MRRSLDTSHVRMTPQRKAVLRVLEESHDHPGVTEIYGRVKTQLPGISLATIYNCLDTLVQNGFIKQVNLERQPSRYCANLQDHAHFHCDRCGKVSDAHSIPGSNPAANWRLPPGSSLQRVEATLRGLCTECMEAVHLQTLT